MEDEDLKDRLLDESKHAHYPCEKNEIRDRYKDVSQHLFKKLQGSLRGSFLSFGSRRSSLVSSYGNTPTFMRRSLSSNGVLEYTVEQMPQSRWNGSRGLPSITAEEKEEEMDAKESNEDEIAMIDADDASKTEDCKKSCFDSESRSSVRATSERRSSISSSATLQASIAESNATIENELDHTLDSKNRKIFLHYDMPIASRKSNYQTSEVAPSMNDVKIDSEGLANSKENIPEEIDLPSEPKKVSLKEALNFEPFQLAKFNSSSKISNCEKEKISILSSLPRDLKNGDLHNSQPVDNPNKHEEMYEIIDSLRKSINALSELEKSLAKDSKKPVFPVISAIDKSDGSKPLVYKDQISASPILPSTGPLFVDSFSHSDFRETISGSPKDTMFNSERDSWSNSLSPRKGSSRMLRHLREKSELSDSDSSKYSDCLASFNSLRESLEEETSSVSFPPLITRAEVESDKKVVDIGPSVLPHVNTNDSAIASSSASFSYSKEDARFGIRSLAADQAINKSFIVVHRKESNSIGLAPLSHGDSNLDQVVSFTRQYSLPVKLKQNTQPKIRKISDSESSRCDLMQIEKCGRSSSTTSESVDTVEQNKKSSRFLFSRGLIKSIPYEDAFEGTTMKEENFECSLNTNTSRLCILM